MGHETATVRKRLPLLSKRALSPADSDWNENGHPLKRPTLHETVASQQTHNDFREENRSLSSGQNTDKFREKTAAVPGGRVEVRSEAKTASSLSFSPRTLKKESNARRARASTGALQSQHEVQSTHCESELKDRVTDKGRLKSVVVVSPKQAIIDKQATDVRSASSAKKNDKVYSNRPAKKGCPRSTLLLEQNKSLLHSNSSPTKARESQLSSDKGNAVEPVCSAKRGTSQPGASSVNMFSRQTTSPDSTTYPGSKPYSSASKYSQLSDRGDCGETWRTASCISGSPSRQTANRVAYQRIGADEQAFYGDAVRGARDHDRDQPSNVSSSSVSLDPDNATSMERNCKDLDATLHSPPTPLRDESTKRFHTDSSRCCATGDSATSIISSRPDVNTMVAQWLQMSAPGKSNEGSVGEKSYKVQEVLQSSNAPVVVKSFSDAPLLEECLPAASTETCDGDQDTVSVSVSSGESYDDLIFVSEDFTPKQAAKETFGDSAACLMSNLLTAQGQGAQPPESPTEAILSGAVGGMESVLFDLHTYTMLSVLDFCRDPGAKQHALFLYSLGNSSNTREACAQDMYRLVRATVERRRIMWKGCTSVLRKLSQLRWILQPTESGLIPRIQDMCQMENVRGVRETTKPRLGGLQRKEH